MHVNVDLAGTAAVDLVPKKPKEMISVKTEGDRTKVRINSSSLDIIQSCLRKAQYSLHEGWIAQDEHPATVFGSGIHKALEVFYSVPPQERRAPSLDALEFMSFGNMIKDEEKDATLRAFRAFVNSVSPSLGVLPESDKRSVQNGAWLLWHYFKSYVDDPYVCHVDAEGPFLERKFTVPVYSDQTLDIELFGTIDFAFRDVRTNQIILGDHKTTSALGWGSQGSYFDREKPNLQYSCYVYGAKEAYGLDSQNFMVNIIEVKLRPKTEKAKGPSFPRQITSRTEDDLLEMKEALIYYVMKFLESTRTGQFPLGPVGACNSYGSCQYRTVCAAPKSIRPNILNAKFTRRDSCQA